MVVSKKDLEKKEKELAAIKKSKTKKLEYLIDCYLLGKASSNPIKIKIDETQLEISESSIKKVLKSYRDIGWQVTYKWFEGKPLYNDFGDYEEYPGWHFDFKY
ncbi:MAG: hypothetical protein KJ939_07010 [Nanoarchaeota archaeon]|nr:hypothetical protein [Nanoarchaeota archaeon]MBU4352796.1 hypothetical protein [Nanoarchaeota archaeon]MCG2719142.1 hypothetical protein [Nanoarchaeota archaeon]